MRIYLEQGHVQKRARIFNNPLYQYDNTMYILHTQFEMPQYNVIPWSRYLHDLEGVNLEGTK